MVKEKFYITTAIDYVNAAPHIGHAYQKIVADVLSRWNKLLGKDVLFVTGTDEYGKKIQESAKKAGIPVKKFVDSIVPKFKEAWKSLNIDYNRFIRTTDVDHRKIVEKFILKCEKNGDIYKGNYSGLYCTGCEQYYTDKDFPDNICPDHNSPLEEIKEETYFFKLSNYTDRLLELYKNHPEFIQPKSRRNEIINRVKEGLHDLSITRTSFNWGIPFILDSNHVTYVWFDALINYYTATREKGRESFWGNSTLHLLGKDNTWFHAVYWPAMLMSAGIKLPKETFSHGFLTFNGQKISKSLGNTINPIELVNKYGSDTIRYFVCRHFPFANGEDGDFDEEALINRHNGELLNKLGNLVSRVSGLIEKNGIEKCENNLKINFSKIKKLMKNYEIDKALNEIFAYIDICNEYVQEKKLWETKNKKNLYKIADSIKKISILLYPFIPLISENISKKFGNYNFTLEEFEKPLSDKIKIIKGDNLFSKILINKKNIKLIDKLNYSKVKKEEKIEGIMTMSEVIFDDFSKLALRVAEIKKVENIDGADKLFKLTIDVGNEIGERIVCAGMKEYYKSNDLVGRKVVYLSNLKPRKMKGVVSEGMLLAAFTKDNKIVNLLNPGKIPNGSLVG